MRWRPGTTRASARTRGSRLQRAGEDTYEAPFCIRPRGGGAVHGPGDRPGRAEAGHATPVVLELRAAGPVVSGHGDDLRVPSDRLRRARPRPPSRGADDRSHLQPCRPHLDGGPVHGGLPGLRTPGDSRWKGPSGEVWARSRPKGSLDVLFRRQVRDRHPRGRGDPGRAYREPRDPRHGYPAGAEGLGLRGGLPSPAPDDELRRPVERRLCRPELGRRQGAARGSEAGGGQARPEPGGGLHAHPAARSRPRDGLQLQHRGDGPRRHPARPGGRQGSGRIRLGEDLEALWHGGGGPLGDRSRRPGARRMLHVHDP